MKYFAIADEFGYLYTLWVYRGKKKHEELYKINLKFNFAKTINIVYDLCTILPKNRAHIVFTDSFFGNVDLAFKLQEIGYYFLLSVKSNTPTNF